MSHRHCLLLAVGLCWSLVLGSAVGQTPPTLAQKSSSSVDTPAIKTFVTECAKKLADSNADSVSKARDALVEASRAGANPVSKEYAVVFAEAVATEMGNILDKVKEVRPRLNAAIVVAKLAEATDGITGAGVRLEPVVMKLLDDSQPDFLQLWGLRAAKPVLADLGTGPNYQKLLERILTVVKQHPSGAMTQEVYDALARPQLVRRTFEPLMGLVQTRIDAYTNGTPEDPDRDANPFATLMRQGIWDVTLTGPQRFRTMQALCSLLTLGSQRADEAANKSHEQLVALVNKLSQGVLVVAMIGQWNNVVGAADQLRKDSAGFGSGKLTEPAKRVVSEIKKIPEYSKLQDASAAPATVPAAVAP